jgi:hypothetical protein
MGELGRCGRRELAPSPATPALVVVIDEHAELVARCGRPALEAIDSIAKRGRAASVTLILANQRATMELLGSEILRANLRVRFCLGVEDPGEVSLALGLGGKKDWPPELLDAPGKFYLRARSQGLNSPRPARGYLATTAQVHRLAAHHAHFSARLDPVSAQAAARHPAAHSRPGADQPPPPPAAATPTRDRPARPAGRPPRWAAQTQKSLGCWPCWPTPARPASPSPSSWWPPGARRPGSMIGLPICSRRPWLSGSAKAAIACAGGRPEVGRLCRDISCGGRSAEFRAVGASGHAGHRSAPRSPRNSAYRFRPNLSTPA